jgi:hypothetical protein
MKIKSLHKITNRNFSIIHNYHSPPSLFLGNREHIFDEDIKAYNPYIQAFLTKRFTHKKEIMPKIKIINPIPTYHDTFYTQKTYPIYNLYDTNHLKYLHNLKIFETGYFISRFFEEYEKPMYDAMLDKLIICGRVPFMDDLSEYNEIKVKIDTLINKFYNGDELSPFEREIERAYLYIKQENFNENAHNASIDKRFKLKEIHITYSEINKQSGHVNFRVMHPEYFFKSAPLFETIDVKLMFNSLFEMRYNSLPNRSIDKFNPKNYYQRAKLKFEYRNSLLEGKHRIEFVSDYIFKQIFQYLDSYEFHNEFGLGLNFKTNFNLMLFHFWLVIQRLRFLNTKFSNFLANDLINKLKKFAFDNIDNLKYLDNSLEIEKVSNYEKYIYQTLDFYTWHFYIFPATVENKYLNIQNLVKDSISSGLVDNKKLSSYFLENFKHINTRTYDDIEKNNFWFTVHRIPINYSMFIENNDTSEFSSYTDIYKEYIDDPTFHKKLIENYNNKKHLLTGKYNPKDFKEICNTLGIPANKDSTNLKKIDYTKTRGHKVYLKLKKIFDMEADILIEQVT